MGTTKDISYLLPFCLGNQAKYVEAVIKHGGCAQAAKALGVNPRTVYRVMAKLKRRATLKGLNPETGLTHEVSDPLTISRVSNYYNHGELAGQWVISKVDQEKMLQVVTEKLEALSKGLPPIPRIPAPRTHVNDDLLTLITISDLHLGMYAWSDETGDDYNTEIAVKRMMDGIGQMVAGSPRSASAIFCLLGDTIHYDGLEAVTPAHRNLLDADTRFARLVDVAGDVTIKAIGMMARKFKKVTVICAEGNHDPAATPWLRKTLSVAFRKNPRIIVDNSPKSYHAYLHGEIFLGFHHADKIKKLEKLPEFFASEPSFRSMWGQAKQSYIHTGHLHKQGMVVTEHGGAVVVRHPTLASKEAYSARAGYTSMQMARAYTYHKTRGEVFSVSVVPDTF